MRGSKSKALRRIARGVLLKSGKDINEKVNVYDQEKNCHSMGPALNEAGDEQLKDGDGVPLLKPTLVPGTIQHANPYRSYSRKLKHMIQAERSNNYHEFSG